ncbi:hypothetical protein V1460_14460 [Streptomyces sp. SCSIO 30461]|uniref:hypothetical protein n=1 Tax=Streptomyces sp. SCSIO 30461 TaxID=3118085 RepID=UPI0030D3C792
MAGRQWLYKHAEDELLDPRTPALPDREALVEPADALVCASHDGYQCGGEVALSAACTSARIGEVSGCRIGDSDTTNWIRTVRRQTTSAPGGLVDKATKGKRARRMPIPFVAVR